MGDQTIFALASAVGRAGVAVFRVSGPDAGSMLLSLSGRTDLPVPRHAQRVRLRHGGEDVDDALALWFPAPRSFTGEDVVELHVHGGRAIAQALSAALVELGGRPAGPGEFSKRAFLSGKLDLTEAEAIADLVDSETAAQRRQALRQLDGGLSRLTEDWRKRVIRALALMEAGIDFSDEEGVPADVLTQVIPLVDGLVTEMETHLAQGQRGERLRDGFHVAILGAPNAGKSSLLNWLSGRDAAIVSAQAGTTRDVIEVHLDLHGWPVVLADTAGLRDEAEEVEAEGIRRALGRAETADLKLVVFNVTQAPHWDQASLDMLDDNALVVINKIDMASESVPSHIQGHPAIPLSVRNGQGMDALLAAMEHRIAQGFGVGEAPILTRARHRQALAACVQALQRFQHADLVELAAEDLRAAAQQVGSIAGRVDVDDILDVVFGEFCIGK